MGYFPVRYDSRVVIYERKLFIRLATGNCFEMVAGHKRQCSRPGALRLPLSCKRLSRFASVKFSVQCKKHDRLSTRFQPQPIGCIFSEGIEL